MKRNNGRNQINDAIAREVSIFTYALGSSRRYQLDVISILKVKKVSCMVIKGNFGAFLAHSCYLNTLFAVECRYICSP